MSAAAAVVFSLADEDDTARLMADLALLLSPGDTVTLSGDLGAGKTTAARALIRYLAGDETLDVPSPTFTLVQLYDLPPFALLHGDLYRIADDSELDEIGLSPWPEDTVTLIEWPERAAAALPADRLDVALRHDAGGGEGTRVATVTGFGAAAAQAARLDMLRRFLEGAGLGRARRTRMAGDASTRSYARLAHDGESLILMNSPRRPDGPPVHDGKSYSQAVHLAEDVRPFVAIANGLRARGFSAPAIRHADLDHGFLVTEDLGSDPVVVGIPPAPIRERYEAATDWLAALHGLNLPDTLPLPLPAHSHAIPPFDVDAMLVEVSLMLDWYLPDRGVAVGPRTRADFFDLWRELLIGRIAGMATTWVLRDYHSPNLIWCGAREGLARVGVIDFQDTVRGPAAYDLVSLLQDARVDVPEDLEIAGLVRYSRARLKADPGFDAAAFAESYAIMSAQRNTRLLGTFARLNRRDGKPHYLRHQPRVWTYLKRSLAHPALHEVRDWYAARVPAPGR
ncbi:MAG: tRNA (adenosine(37)-N6)-threonylcarbamoyltransferase complex ATPase subunit type 1 TsaE [Xanthobacteraceae bacterium]